MNDATDELLEKLGQFCKALGFIPIRIHVPTFHDSAETLLVAQRRMLVCTDALPGRFAAFQDATSSRSLSAAAAKQDLHYGEDLFRSAGDQLGKLAEFAQKRAEDVVHGRNLMWGSIPVYLIGGVGIALLERFRPGLGRFIQMCTGARMSIIDKMVRSSISMAIVNALIDAGFQGLEYTSNPLVGGVRTQFDGVSVVSSGIEGLADGFVGAIGIDLALHKWAQGSDAGWLRVAKAMAGGAAGSLVSGTAAGAASGGFEGLAGYWQGESTSQTWWNALKQGALQGAAMGAAQGATMGGALGLVTGALPTGPESGPSPQPVTALPPTPDSGQAAARGHIQDFLNQGLISNRQAVRIAMQLGVDPRQLDFPEPTPWNAEAETAPTPVSGAAETDSVSPREHYHAESAVEREDGWNSPSEFRNKDVVGHQGLAVTEGQLPDLDLKDSAFESGPLAVFEKDSARDWLREQDPEVQQFVFHAELSTRQQIAHIAQSGNPDVLGELSHSLNRIGERLDETDAVNRRVSFSLYSTMVQNAFGRLVGRQWEDFKGAADRNSVVGHAISQDEHGMALAFAEFVERGVSPEWAGARTSWNRIALNHLYDFYKAKYEGRHVSYVLAGFREAFNLRSRLRAHSGLPRLTPVTLLKQDPPRSVILAEMLKGDQYRHIADAHDFHALVKTARSKDHALDQAARDTTRVSAESVHDTLARLWVEDAPQRTKLRELLDAHDDLKLRKQAKRAFARLSYAHSQWGSSFQKNPELAEWMLAHEHASVVASTHSPERHARAAVSLRTAIPRAQRAAGEMESEALSHALIAVQGQSKAARTLLRQAQPLTRIAAMPLVAQVHEMSSSYAKLRKLGTELLTERTKATGTRISGRIAESFWHAARGKLEFFASRDVLVQVREIEKFAPEELPKIFQNPPEGTDPVEFCTNLPKLIKRIGEVYDQHAKSPASGRLVGHGSTDFQRRREGDWYGKHKVGKGLRFDPRDLHTRSATGGGGKQPFGDTPNSDAVIRKKWAQFKAQHKTADFLPLGDVLDLYRFFCEKTASGEEMDNGNPWLTDFEIAVAYSDTDEERNEAFQVFDSYITGTDRFGASANVNLETALDSAERELLRLAGNFSESLREPYQEILDDLRNPSRGVGGLLGADQIARTEFLHAFMLRYSEIRTDVDLRNFVLQWVDQYPGTASLHQRLNSEPDNIRDALAAEFANSEPQTLRQTRLRDFVLQLAGGEYDENSAKDLTALLASMRRSPLLFRWHPELLSLRILELFWPRLRNWDGLSRPQPDDAQALLLSAAPKHPNGLAEHQLRLLFADSHQAEYLSREVAIFLEDLPIKRRQRMLSKIWPTLDTEYQSLLKQDGALSKAEFDVLLANVRDLPGGNAFIDSLTAKLGDELTVIRELWQNQKFGRSSAMDFRREPEAFLRTLEEMNTSLEAVLSTQDRGLVRKAESILGNEGIVREYVSRTSSRFEDLAEPNKFTHFLRFAVISKTLERLGKIESPTGTRAVSDALISDGRLFWVLLARHGADFASVIHDLPSADAIYQAAHDVRMQQRGGKLSRDNLIDGLVGLGQQNSEIDHSTLSPASGNRGLFTSDDVSFHDDLSNGQIAVEADKWLKNPWQMIWAEQSQGGWVSIVLAAGISRGVFNEDFVNGLLLQRKIAGYALKLENLHELRTLVSAQVDIKTKPLVERVFAHAGELSRESINQFEEGAGDAGARKALEALARADQEAAPTIRTLQKRLDGFQQALARLLYRDFRQENKSVDDGGDLTSYMDKAVLDLFGNETKDLHGNAKTLKSYLLAICNLNLAVNDKKGIAEGAVYLGGQQVHVQRRSVEVDGATEVHFLIEDEEGISAHFIEDNIRGEDWQGYFERSNLPAVFGLRTNESKGERISLPVAHASLDAHWQFAVVQAAAERREMLEQSFVWSQALAINDPVLRGRIIAASTASEKLQIIQGEAVQEEGTNEHNHIDRQFEWTRFRAKTANVRSLNEKLEILGSDASYKALAKYLESSVSMDDARIWSAIYGDLWRDEIGKKVLDSSDFLNPEDPSRSDVARRHRLFAEALGKQTGVESGDEAEILSALVRQPAHFEKLFITHPHSLLSWLERMHEEDPQQVTVLVRNVEHARNARAALFAEQQNSSGGLTPDGSALSDSLEWAARGVESLQALPQKIRDVLADWFDDPNIMLHLEREGHRTFVRSMISQAAQLGDLYFPVAELLSRRYRAAWLNGTPLQAEAAEISNVVLSDRDNFDLIRFSQIEQTEKPAIDRYKELLAASGVPFGASGGLGRGLGRQGRWHDGPSANEGIGNRRQFSRNVMRSDGTGRSTGRNDATTWVPQDSDQQEPLFRIHETLRLLLRHSRGQTFASLVRMLLVEQLLRRMVLSQVLAVKARGINGISDSRLIHRSNPEYLSAIFSEFIHRINGAILGRSWSSESKVDEALNSIYLAASRELRVKPEEIAKIHREQRAYNEIRQLQSEIREREVARGSSFVVDSPRSAAALRPNDTDRDAGEGGPLSHKVGRRARGYVVLDRHGRSARRVGGPVEVPGSNVNSNGAVHATTSIETAVLRKLDRRFGGRAEQTWQIIETRLGSSLADAAKKLEISDSTIKRAVREFAWCINTSLTDISTKESSQIRWELEVAYSAAGRFFGSEAKLVAQVHRVSRGVRPLMKQVFEKRFQVDDLVAASPFVGEDWIGASRQISSLQRDLLILHELGGFTSAEVARWKSYESSTVRKHVSSACQRVSEIIDGNSRDHKVEAGWWNPAQATENNSDKEKGLLASRETDPLLKTISQLPEKARSVAITRIRWIESGGEWANKVEAWRRHLQHDPIRSPREVGRLVAETFGSYVGSFWEKLRLSLYDGNLDIDKFGFIRESAAHLALRAMGEILEETPGLASFRERSSVSRRLAADLKLAATVEDRLSRFSLEKYVEKHGASSLATYRGLPEFAKDALLHRVEVSRSSPKSIAYDVEHFYAQCRNKKMSLPDRSMYLTRGERVAARIAAQSDDPALLKLFGDELGIPVQTLRSLMTKDGETSSADGSSTEQS